MNLRSSFAGLALVAAAIPAFAAPVASGLKPGERVTPFNPKHLAGPLAGTEKCFPCTFQNRPQVQVWVNGKPESVLPIATSLSKAMQSHKDKEFKALVVFVTTPKTVAQTEAFVKKAAQNPAVAGVGMAILDKDNEAVANYKINTESDVQNTVFAYKNWQVQKSFVNLAGDKAGLTQLDGAIAEVTK